MITRLEATRYRCFDQLNLDLGPLGVIVGSNGSGKTTLLDIPVLLGDLLKARNIGSAFLNPIQQRGPRATSFTELVHLGLGDSFILAVEAKLPERVVRDLLEGASDTIRSKEEKWPTHIRYELRLQIFNQRDLQIQNEYLFTFAEQHSPPRSDVGAAPRLHGEINPRREWSFTVRREYGGESSFRIETKGRAKPKNAAIGPDLLALPKVQFESRNEYPAARWFFDLLAQEAIFLDPDWNALRMPSPPGQSSTLLPNARNLPWLALHLKQQNPELFEAWKEHVRIGLPQITDIDIVEREEDHHAYFRVTYQHGYVVTSSGLSDGTLRVLALTLPAYLPVPPRFLAVEEPENGIHPRAIEAVLEALSSIRDSQVLLSSHSPVVVAHTALSNLITARQLRSGAVEIVPGSKHPRLADWKGAIDLGTLFAAGVLG